MSAALKTSLLSAVVAVGLSIPGGASAHGHVWAWDCKGKVTSPHSHESFESLGRWTFWKVGGQVFDKFVNHTTRASFWSKGWFRYNGHDKQYHHSSVNSFGGWSQSTLKIVDEDNLEWNGTVRTLGHAPLLKRSALHRTGKGGVDWTLDVAEQEGEWQRMYEGHCQFVGQHPSRDPEDSTGNDDDADSDDDSDDGDESDNDGDDEDLVNVGEDDPAATQAADALLDLLSR